MSITLLSSWNFPLQVTYAEDDNLIPDRTLYPVIVWIHDGDFVEGTSQKYPGHVLATREVVTVTFNYRLGALGKLSVKLLCLFNHYMYYSLALLWR